MLDDEFCFWHSEKHAEEAEQARKLGGARRRRESTLQGAYDLQGLDSVPGIRRVLALPSPTPSDSRIQPPASACLSRRPSPPPSCSKSAS